MTADTNLPTIHVLYENADWLPPLTAALENEGFTVALHLVWKDAIDPRQEPAEGIWINRMSPSSHTRGHGESVGLMRETLAWLESWGRRVINGSHAMELEVSKLRQELVLHRHGILSPRTYLANNREELVRVAGNFKGAFITKHNQGGKGLGIELFSSAQRLDEYLELDVFDWGPTGQIVLQEYITSAEPFITRIEIVGGQFVYAMESATDDGFQLCPSDACQVPSSAPNVCPADDGGDDPDAPIALTSSGRPKFGPSPVTAEDPLVRQLIEMTIAEGLEQAGIEFVEDKYGNRYVYDINGTTNYSSAIERHFDVDGMSALAAYIKGAVVPGLHDTDDDVTPRQLATRRARRKRS
ncbi:MAG: glutathione synthase/RimK-type ligase-like ATP-grasp enzyme [Flavobacteriales bacterium]|jgi:glutathione synthase/RimK-type ligase-like ATP-grasp enzyme